MFKRPSAGETEDDLLRLQEEFRESLEKNETTTPEKKQEVVVEKTNETVIGVIGDIVERRDIAAATTRSNVGNMQENGFPKVFRVDVNASSAKKKKKSLFAMKLEENKKNSTDMDDAMEVDEPKESFSPEMKSIHQENVAKISSMSREEVDEQRRALEASMNPELLVFLKNRGAKKNVEKVAEKIDSSEENVAPIDLKKVEENVLNYVHEEWLTMDKIEPEKLQWIGEIPDSHSLESDQPYSARFDFSGDLQPFKTEVDVRKSLHHHGDEADRPGYTIQELYQLVRSTVLPQRIVALNTLANIIRKTKMGYYDHCFDGYLLKKMVESDVFFLLRFAIDDRAITTAAINCLHEFFVHRSDEVCLNRLLNVTDEDIEPSLYVEVELDKDCEENELKDHQLLAQDIVRGVLRTDLLVRFAYVLREFDPDRISIAKILECLIRISRHSTEACEAVYNTPGILSYVFDNISSSEPIHQAISLLRVLSRSPSLAKAMVSNFSFKFILQFVDMDQPMYKLKLESLHLWKSLARSGLLLDEVLSFSSCLIRLLWFFAEKVDVHHGRFDFELFSGIVSLLNTVTALKVPLDHNFYTVIGICLEKWLSQMTRDAYCNFSTSKAISCAFRFFSLQFSNHGVVTGDLEMLKKLRKSLNSFLCSQQCVELSDRLITYSHILKFKASNRDPENLPALNSIYANGDDHLRIIQDESVLPLFMGMAEFLLKSFEISHDVRLELELFSKVISKYSETVLETPPTSSWFSRYEMRLLTFVLEIFKKLGALNVHELAFRCINHYRSDDKLILIALKMILPIETFPIYETYFSAKFKDALFHSCENVPCDWLYGPVASSPLQVLEFISGILQSNPHYLSYVPYTLRYYRLCLVFLNEENIFEAHIKRHLEICLSDILSNFGCLDLNIPVSPGKSFYDLYTELVSQYAGTSYGDFLFAKFVTLPLAQKFDISFRKLLWSEYMHALRVITLPSDISGFIPLDVFVTPMETDESLLVLYLNAAAKQVLTKTRNGFIYSVAVENLRRYLKSEFKDAQLSQFLTKRIGELRDSSLKSALLN